MRFRSSLAVRLDAKNKIISEGITMLSTCWGLYYKLRIGIYCP